MKILAGENSKIVRRYQHRYVAWSRTIRFIQQIGIPEYQEIIENKQELIRGFKLMIMHYILFFNLRQETLLEWLLND